MRCSQIEIRAPCAGEKVGKTGGKIPFWVDQNLYLFYNGRYEYYISSKKEKAQEDPRIFGAVWQQKGQAGSFQAQTKRPLAAHPIVCFQGTIGSMRRAKSKT